jgi:hypothetical protein
MNAEDEALLSAHHKAITLQGMMASPRGREKTEVMAGLVSSLLNDIDTLVCVRIDAIMDEVLAA